jgi:RPA family protein
VEVQWNNTKKCVLDTISDLVEKVDREARQPWISYTVINKMNEQRKLQNVNNEEGMNNYRTLRNKLHKAKDKAKKEYF